MIIKKTDNMARYDFRRSSRFTGDQLLQLEAIHEKFAGLVSDLLVAYLCLPVKIRLETVEQLKYREVSYSLPTLLSIFSAQGSAGSMVLETGARFVYPIIDALLGGEGRPAKQDRALTEIEQRVASRVSSRMLATLAQAWQEVMPVSPVVVSTYTDPRHCRLIDPNETVAQLSFSTQTGCNRGSARLIFPYSVVKTFLLEGKSSGSSRSDNHWQRAELKIGETEVELAAVLGKATITIEELLNYRDGDILLLDSKAGEDASLCLHGRPLFTVSLGTIGSRLGGVVMENLVDRGLSDGAGKKRRQTS